MPSWVKFQPRTVFLDHPHLRNGSILRPSLWPSSGCCPGWTNVPGLSSAGNWTSAPLDFSKFYSSARQNPANFQLGFLFSFHGINATNVCLICQLSLILFPNSRNSTQGLKLNPASVLIFDCRSRIKWRRGQESRTRDLVFVFRSRTS